MQSLNISLPDLLKHFADQQVVQGRYDSVSEYVRDLIIADEMRKAEEQLETRLLEGLDSVESEMVPADWGAIRRDALTVLDERKRLR